MNPAWPVRNFTGYSNAPPHPRWPNEARIAVSFCLNYEEGGEYATDLGDAHSESYLGEICGREAKKERDPSIESEFEYGARAGVWRVLQLFEEVGFKCTVWGVGKALEANENVARQMVEAGHEVAGHGYRWIDYSKLSEEEEATQVEALLDSITRTTGGIPPVGHYVGRHSLNTLALLVKAHHARGTPFLYSSDTYADDLPFWVPSPGGTKEEGLLMIPYALDNNDVKFGLSNGFGSPDDIFVQLKNAFDFLYDEGTTFPKMMSIGLHARISGRPARAHALKRFMLYIKEKEHVWVATRKEIAEHWIARFPYEAPAE